MNESNAAPEGKGVRVAVAVAWVVFGVGLAAFGGQAVYRGVAALPKAGLWYNRFVIAAGLAMVVTGVCYYFMSGVKAYLDKEADQLAPGGRYRWFYWYTLVRFFRR